jgi:uncharacterized protein
VSERPVIVDTGPLVAFLFENEARHAWATEQFKTLPSSFLTCEPVLTEAFHILRHSREGGRQFFQLLQRGVLKVDFELMNEKSGLEKLIEKYHDLPMSLADACLVRMAEQYDTAAVFTLDRDFKIYRKRSRIPIPVIMPE